LTLGNIDFAPSTTKHVDSLTTGQGESFWGRASMQAQKTLLFATFVLTKKVGILW
jgi:hypothetical protein